MFWQCPFKAIFGVPCPTCGTTRALVALLKGNFGDAFHINPLGIFVTITIVIYMGLRIIDSICGTFMVEHLFNRPFEQLKKNHKGLLITIISFSGIIAVLNAYWNYIKGL